jgi:hypothetical protein
MRALELKAMGAARHERAAVDGKVSWSSIFGRRLRDGFAMHGGEGEGEGEEEGEKEAKEGKSEAAAAAAAVAAEEGAGEEDRGGDAEAWEEAAPEGDFASAADPPGSCDPVVSPPSAALHCHRGPDSPREVLSMLMPRLLTAVLETYTRFLQPHNVQYPRLLTDLAVAYYSHPSEVPCELEQTERLSTAWHAAVASITPQRWAAMGFAGPCPTPEKLQGAEPDWAALGDRAASRMWPPWRVHSARPLLWLQVCAFVPIVPAFAELEPTTKASPRFRRDADPFYPHPCAVTNAVQSASELLRDLLLVVGQGAVTAVATHPLVLRAVPCRGVCIPESAFAPHLPLKPGNAPAPLRPEAWAEREAAWTALEIVVQSTSCSDVQLQLGKWLLPSAVESLQSVKQKIAKLNAWRRRDEENASVDDEPDEHTAMEAYISADEQWHRLGGHDNPELAEEEEDVDGGEEEDVDGGEEEDVDGDDDGESDGDDEEDEYDEFEEDPWSDMEEDYEDEGHTTDEDDEDNYVPDEDADEDHDGRVLLGPWYESADRRSFLKHAKLHVQEVQSDDGDEQDFYAAKEPANYRPERELCSEVRFSICSTLAEFFDTGYTNPDTLADVVQSVTRKDYRTIFRLLSKEFMKPFATERVGNVFRFATTLFESAYNMAMEEALPYSEKSLRAYVNFAVFHRRSLFALSVALAKGVFAQSLVDSYRDMMDAFAPVLEPFENRMICWRTVTWVTDQLKELKSRFSREPVLDESSQTLAFRPWGAATEALDRELAFVFGCPELRPLRKPEAVGLPFAETCVALLSLLESALDQVATKLVDVDWKEMNSHSIKNYQKLVPELKQFLRDVATLPKLYAQGTSGVSALAFSRASIQRAVAKACSACEPLLFHHEELLSKADQKPLAAIYITHVPELLEWAVAWPHDTGSYDCMSAAITAANESIAFFDRALAYLAPLFTEPTPSNIKAALAFTGDPKARLQSPKSNACLPLPLLQTVSRLFVAFAERKASPSAATSEAAVFPFTQFRALLRHVKHTMRFHIAEQHALAYNNMESMLHMAEFVRELADVFGEWEEGARSPDNGGASRHAQKQCAEVLEELLDLLPLLRFFFERFVFESLLSTGLPELTIVGCEAGAGPNQRPWTSNDVYDTSDTVAPTLGITFKDDHGLNIGQEVIATIDALSKTVFTVAGRTGSQGRKVRERFVAFMLQCAQLVGQLVHYVFDIETLGGGQGTLESVRLHRSVHPAPAQALPALPALTVGLAGPRAVPGTEAGMPAIGAHSAEAVATVVAGAPAGAEAPGSGPAAATAAAETATGEAAAAASSAQAGASEFAAECQEDEDKDASPLLLAPSPGADLLELQQRRRQQRLASGAPRPATFEQHEPPVPMDLHDLGEVMGDGAVDVIEDFGDRFRALMEKRYIRPEALRRLPFLGRVQKHWA